MAADPVRMVPPEGAEILLRGHVQLLRGARKRYLGYQLFARQGDPLSVFRAWGEGDSLEEVVGQLEVYFDALAAGRVSWPEPVNHRRHVYEAERR